VWRSDHLTSVRVGAVDGVECTRPCGQFGQPPARVDQRGDLVVDLREVTLDEGERVLARTVTGTGSIGRCPADAQLLRRVDLRPVAR
jgi:hypothetical protein